MGTFDCNVIKIDIKHRQHGAFLALHSEETATFKNLLSNPFNVMFINKKCV